VNVVQLAPRRCEGCGGDLPPLSRPNRRYHDAACRARGRRRRRREEAERQFAVDANATARRDALTAATSEERLLLQIAKAAANGSVRSSIYLLERFYGPGPRGEQVDDRRQGDELAAIRARIARRR
jgi:hypothetical protein